MFLFGRRGVDAQVVVPDDGSTNVALASNGATATASSTFQYYAGHDATRLNDGGTSGAVRAVGTHWLPNVWLSDPDAGSNIWVQIDLATAHTVSTVVVHSQQTLFLAPITAYSDTTTTRGIGDFRVQTWNGSAWVTQATVTGNTLARRVVNISPVGTTKVRVLLDNVLNNRACLAEVEVWTGAAPTVAATPAAPTGRFTIAGTPYNTLAAAFAAIQDGQTLDIAPGDYRTDCGYTEKNNITIRCVGGEAVFYSAFQGQGAINLEGRDVTVSGLAGVGITNDSSNGCLIRFFGDTITCSNMRTDLCEMGFLSGVAFPNSIITLNDWTGTRSEGRGGGLGHGIYIGYCRAAYVNRANISNTYQGHCLKSRANKLIVRDCTLTEGPASAAIDSSLGGILEVYNTTMVQTPETDNLYIVTYGAEAPRLLDGVTRFPYFPASTPNIVYLDVNTVATDTKVPPTGFIVKDFLVPTQFVNNATYNGVHGVAQPPPTYPADPVATPVNTASYVRTDSTTSGNWHGVYGAQGYVISGGTFTDYYNGTHFQIPGDTLNLPAYATVDISGSLFTWDEAPTDPRAPQRATTGRIASAHVGNYYIDIDFRLGDDLDHEIALYFVDWDSVSRSATIQALDPNNNVLASTTVSSFFNGKYVVFKLRGTITLRIISTGINAVLNGIFFDAATPPATGSRLATLAPTMANNTWGALTTANINVSLSDPGSPNTNLRMHYCNSAPWNPLTGGIDFIGMDHGGRPALCRYKDATGSWDNFVPTIGSHGYQHTVVDPNTGDIYRIMYGVADPNYSYSRVDGVYKVLPNGTDVRICATPENLSQLIAGAGVWWDGQVTGGNGAQGGLVFYSGNFGYIYILNLSTLVWTPVQVVPDDVGVYHNVCAYSKAFNCLVVGGGNDNGAGTQVNKQIWRVDSDLSTHRLPNAPLPVGVYNGMNMVAGPDGMIYFLGSVGTFPITGTGQHWKLDPRGAGTWTRLADPPAGVLFQNDHEAEFSSCTPYGVVYVYGRNVSGVLDIKMHLYKLPLTNEGGQSLDT